MEVRRILYSSYTYILCFFLIWTKTHALGGLENPDQLTEDVKKSQFPDGFVFGVATSAYQIEGATAEDGRGLSNWDVFVRSGHVRHGDTADVADDHYHRYLEDIERIHSLGVDAYRFSISWSRIFPKGKFGDVNPAGISFYNNIIDNLLLRGIRPFVTIHHEDYPQELLDRYGGWLSPLMQDDFMLFAETCFKRYGDRVKYWITINEPNLASEAEYERGIYPPGRCSPPFGNCSAGGNSDTEPLISMHNMLLAHAKAAKLYREHFQAKQGGMLGIVATAMMLEPKSDSEQDQEAMTRSLAFSVGWTFDPVVFGYYPPEMRHYHGSELPMFTPEEQLLLRNSIDFIGLNHYGTLYATDCLHRSCPCFEPSCSPGANRAIRGFVSTNGIRNGVPIGEPTGVTRFFVVPRGIEKLVNYVKKRYHNMPIFITENGYSSPEKSHHGSLDDVKRIAYHKAYLSFLARAIRDGADVRGYFIWSLMDNFEWQDGYSTKFGLYAVDRLTLKRTPKSSAKWYRNFLKNNSLENADDLKHKRTVFPLRLRRSFMKEVEEEEEEEDVLII